MSNVTQNVTQMKLDACLFVLEKVMDYHDVCDKAFEYMGGSINTCSFCKIPFFTGDSDCEDDEDSEHNKDENFCHERNIPCCKKMWCGRSEFCDNQLVRCILCDEFICVDHSYSNYNECSSIIEIFCRNCIKTKRIKPNVWEAQFQSMGYVDFCPHSITW